MLTTLWRSRLTEGRNYLRHRFDIVTRIEMTIAVGVVFYFFLSYILDQLKQFDHASSIKEWWISFQTINVWLVLMVGVTGFSHALRSWLPNRLRTLLPLPISPRILAIHHLSELAIPGIIQLPFWLIWNILLLFNHMDPAVALSALILNLSMYGAFLQLGMLSAQLLQARSLVRHRLQALGAWVMVLISQTALIYGQFTLPVTRAWISVLFLCQLMIWGLATAVWISGFHFIAERDPSLLMPQPRKRARRHGSTWFEKGIVWPVPMALRTFVIKDLRYALRCYRGYPLLVFLFTMAMVLALMRAGNGRDALQWQLSLTIAMAYILSNAAFRFNTLEAENWALVKSLPLSASNFWWAKFYVIFTPMIWFIAIGHVLVLLRYQPPLPGLLLNLAGCVAISLTLAFLQTNFSLYTFPFARYASLGYNVYIWTAVLFFTILLFPPLAVVFLFYGFYAIRRVLKRFDNWVME